MHETPPQFVPSFLRETGSLLCGQSRRANPTIEPAQASAAKCDRAPEDPVNAEEIPPVRFGLLRDGFPRADPALALVILRLAPQDLADNLCRKTAPMQKAKLPGALLQVGRRLPEALAPDGACLLQFGTLEQSCGLLQHLTGKTLPAQVAEHALRTVAASRPRHKLFSEPLLGEPATPLEVIQQCGKLGGVSVRAAQLFRQFQARVVARRKQPQGTGAQAAFGRRAGRSA
jgi:hypothetical protein